MITDLAEEAAVGLVVVAAWHIGLAEALEQRQVVQVPADAHLILGSFGKRCR